jgi:hypothetical protein
MGQTIVEKIAQKHMAEGPSRPLRTGDFLSIRPHRCMTHDNTSAVMSKFKGIGAKKVKDPQQLTFALDHDIQNQDEANLKKYRAIEAFAKEQGVDFYPAGIGHRPPDHGGARVCRSRFVRGRVRFAFQYVWRAGRDRHADCPHGRGRGLGHGRILVADSAVDSGCARRQVAGRASRARTSSSLCAASITTTNA